MGRSLSRSTTKPCLQSPTRSRRCVQTRHACSTKRDQTSLLTASWAIAPQPKPRSRALAPVCRSKPRLQAAAGVPMDPGAGACEFAPERRRYTLYAGTGGGGRLKDALAKIRGAPADQVRVIMRDVGGNFGTRGM